jgi:ribose/xylose/arabinose/galactoside ABC-type transport system permease subunit
MTVEMSVLEPVATGRPAGRRWWLTLVPNLVWEVLLAIALVVVVITVTVSTVLFDRVLPWGQFATVGFAASAVALSLRTRTPNLAVSGLAGFAGSMFADRVTSGTTVVSAMLVAVATCMVVGCVLGVVVGLTNLPAWALTLGVGTLLQAIYVSQYGGGRPIPLDGPGVQLDVSDMRTWTFGFAVLSLGGAVAVALPTVRQSLGITRVAGDAPRFDASRLVAATVGLGGSSMLAGLAGVLYVRWTGVADGSSTSNMLLPALAAALLGGVSAYGGRGGFAGVILGVGLVVVLNSWMPFGSPGSFGVRLGFFAATILVGLLVSWATELAVRAIDAQPEAPPTAEPPVDASPADASPVGSPEPARGTL